VAHVNGEIASALCGQSASPQGAIDRALIPEVSALERLTREHPMRDWRELDTRLARLSSGARQQLVRLREPVTRRDAASTEGQVRLCARSLVESRSRV
jgi:hypothetical protein